MKKPKIAIRMWLYLVVIFLLSGCQQKQNILPPNADDQVLFETKNLICYHEQSTTYSLGSFVNTYIFTKDSFTVKNKEDEQTYVVTYSPQEVDKQKFGELLQTLSSNSEVDISRYKKISQYNLTEGTNNEPGYRLYILDDEYWMGTLCGDRLWRCVAIEPTK